MADDKQKIKQGKSSIPSTTAEEMVVDPSLIKIVSELLPNYPDRVIPIAREAQRKKERLSSIPFYAAKAEREGDNYWVRLSISYRGND